MATKYDLIVVGAGPGGTAAAKTAAEKKLKVLMLERARTPGEKNMSGSYLFRDICTEIFPGFQEQEFHKGHIRIGGITFEWVLDNDEKRYGMITRMGGDAMRDMMTVFRPETDKWFAEQAVKAGVELKTALATDLIWDNTKELRVKGVVTDKGNFEAPFVIDASGLHSELGRKSGLVQWSTGKVMLALKYIYKLDGEVMRKRMGTYIDSDGVETDWGCMPTLAGWVPDYWGSHLVGDPGRGIINLIVYQGLKELVKSKVNIHQRAQWLVKQPPYSQLLEGAEFVRASFHCLTSGDIEGYLPKTYLPGYVLVGDAGGFAQVVDNYGANVAQYLGRMAAELAVEMKEKKDYSEAMFKKYEDTWRNSWVGDDDVHELNFLIRDGSFQTMMECADKAMGEGFIQKWKLASYPAIFGAALPKFLPILPILLEMPYLMKSSVAVGVKKMGGLMAMLGMGPK